MEGMATLSNNTIAEIIELILAQSTDAQSFLAPALCGNGTLLGAQRTMNNQVGMINRLSEPHDEIKDVCVIVEDCALFNIGVKVGETVLVHRLVEVCLLSTECILSNTNVHRRQLQIVVPLSLGPPQKDPIEHICAQSFYGSLPCAEVTILLDRIRNSGGKVAPMLHLRMTTLSAGGSLGIKAVMQGNAVAAFLGAEIMGIGVESQKSNDAIDVCNTILQRCA
mmetsp:Transcript_28795/g.66967  ORF Transcript_28795/g.66967 Transcript_28795/m.66967 type:complete len:223 (+) Transcript_28795:887-1555(+)